MNSGFSGGCELAMRETRHAHRVARQSLVHTEHREDLSCCFDSVSARECQRCILLKPGLILKLHRWFWYFREIDTQYALAKKSYVQQIPMLLMSHWIQENLISPNVSTPELVLPVWPRHTSEKECIGMVHFIHKPMDIAWTWCIIHHA